jgi:hypothetical protein
VLSCSLPLACIPQLLAFVMFCRAGSVVAWNVERAEIRCEMLGHK